MADSTRRLTLDEVAERIMARSIPEPNSGCWLWEGATNQRPKGSKQPIYASVRLRGRMVKIQRVTYEWANGPIPDGMQVLHRCDVSLCCNPAHLFIGTNDENHADKAAKDRGKKRLTLQKAKDIHTLRRRGMSQRAIAESFGIDRSIVSRILSGKRRSFAMPAQL